MKNYPISLLFILFFSSILQAQVDLRIGSISGGGSYVCDESVSFGFTVFNRESTAVSSYDIIILDGGLEVYRETITEVLAGNATREFNIDIIPPTYFNHSYRLEVYHPDDVNLVNNYYNFFNPTAFMNGGEFEVKIIGNYKAYAQFYMFTDFEDQFEVYSSGSSNPDGSVFYDFCFPWDSCGTIEIHNPFIPGWCEFVEEFWKYDFMVDSKTDYTPGDTVAIPGGIAYDFYILLEPKTDDDLWSAFGPADFLEPIYCDEFRPSDLEERKIEITNTVTGEELGVLNEVPHQIVYSLDFCMFEDDVAVNELEKHEELNPYPNPSSDFVNFGKELEFVKVYDLSGKQIREVRNASFLDISNLNAGMYILQSQNNHVNYTGSFIKE